MHSVERRTRIIAVLLAAVVFVVLVSPFVDLDPTTLCNAGLLAACVIAAYRVPKLSVSLTQQMEQVVFRQARTLTDINCSRLC